MWRGIGPAVFVAVLLAAGCINFERFRAADGGIDSGPPGQDGGPVDAGFPPVTLRTGGFDTGSSHARAGDGGSVSGDGVLEAPLTSLGTVDVVTDGGHHYRMTGGLIR